MGSPMSVQTKCSATVTNGDDKSADVLLLATEQRHFRKHSASHNSAQLHTPSQYSETIQGTVLF